MRPPVDPKHQVLSREQAKHEETLKRQQDQTRAEMRRYQYLVETDRTEQLSKEGFER